MNAVIGTGRNTYRVTFTNGGNTTTVRVRADSQRDALVKAAMRVAGRFLATDAVLTRKVSGSA